jgi:hypothetical protein
LAIGRSHLNGTGDLTFSRQGNKILITGDVIFDSVDPYDFEKGEQLAFLADPAGAAWRLQEYGDAQPFDMIAKWRRKIVATLAKDRGQWRLAAPVRWIDPHPAYTGSEK